MHLLAARKADCEITVRGRGGRLQHSGAADIVEVCLLAFGDQRTFTRKDGSCGEMLEAIVGDRTGTSRLVCWAPALLADSVPGTGLRLRGFTRQSRPAGEEIQIDETAVVEQCNAGDEVPRSPLAGIREGPVHAAEGVLEDPGDIRSFTTRQGGRSRVRNALIRDATGSIGIVLWGKHATAPLAGGDRITVFHATARKGRTGETELHAGHASAVLIRRETARDIEFEGTILPTICGNVIDNGDAWYFLADEYPAGREVRVKGVVEGKRITPLSIEPLHADPAGMREKARRLIRCIEEGVGGPGSHTFAPHGGEPL